MMKRSLASMLIALALHLVLALGIFFSFQFFLDLDPFIELSLLTEVALRQRPDIRRLTVTEVRAAFEAVVQLSVLAGALASVVWHFATGLLRVVGPGRATRFVGLWLLLLVTAGIGAAFTSYWYLAIDTDLVRREAVTMVMTGSVVLTWLCFHLVGTLFPTTALFRPAVPLATFVR
jgi:hypothetical protein